MDHLINSITISCCRKSHVTDDIMPGAISVQDLFYDWMEVSFLERMKQEDTRRKPVFWALSCPSVMSHIRPHTTPAHWPLSVCVHYCNLFIVETAAGGVLWPDPEAFMFVNWRWATSLLNAVHMQAAIQSSLLSFECLCHLRCHHVWKIIPLLHCLP